MAFNNTSGIIIDQVTNLPFVGATTITANHRVSSLDSIVVVLVTHEAAAIPTSVSFGGMRSTVVVSVQTTLSSSIWVLQNPPVGNFPIVVTAASTSGLAAVALSILGVKKNTNFNTATTSGTTTAFNLPVNVSTANSMIVDVLDCDSVPVSDIGQTRIISATSFKIASPGSQMMSWTFVNGPATLAAIVLEPANAPSIWYPTIDPREIKDSIPQESGDSSLQANYGYKPSTFYKNSFLHTVGRMFGANTGGPYAIVNNSSPQSSIIIEQVTISRKIDTFDHQVFSQDSVLVVFTYSQTTNPGFVSFGGMNMTLLDSTLITVTAGSVYRIKIWYLHNPPVGRYPVSLSSSNTSIITAITLSGVNKAKVTPSVFAKTNSEGVDSTLAIDTPVANSLILSAFEVMDFTQAGTANQISWPTNQTPINYYNIALNPGYAVSYLIVNSPISYSSYRAMNTLIPKMGHHAIVFEPARAASSWNPTLRMRNIQDVINVNGFDATLPISTGFSQGGNFPSQFWRNSFLHTVGRTLDPTQSAVVPGTGTIDWPTFMDRGFMNPRFSG